MVGVQGLRLAAVEDVDQLRPVVALFAEMWGRNEDGVPVPTEVLKSLVHADGLVSAAYDDTTGELVGAAALGRAAPGECYGYIAAARPGFADRGIGFALKQHQRGWALRRGVSRMSWTFDPLVARNARFNLTKLGARVFEYLPGFYGVMADLQNASDIGDRLVARWDLDSARAELAARGLPMAEAEPDPGATVGGVAPDGDPGLLETRTDRWVRVPSDIVALRAGDPVQAGRWRDSTREVFTALFDDHWVADAVSRQGWYHLAREASPDAPPNDPPHDPVKEAR